MLGIRSNALNKWGHKLTYNYSALPETEKQAYLPAERINILTDKRIIEVVSLRPIDHLYMVLNYISQTDSRNSNLAF